MSQVNCLWTTSKFSRVHNWGTTILTDPGGFRGLLFSFDDLISILTRYQMHYSTDCDLHHVFQLYAFTRYATHFKHEFTSTHTHLLSFHSICKLLTSEILNQELNLGKDNPGLLR